MRWQQLATNEEMKTEFAYFGEVWSLFKKYYHVQQEDSYWEKLIKEAGAINQKYQCELCKDLILAVMNELERKGVNKT
jgi:hypothetical protein